jgi:hypothetical protein
MAISPLHSFSEPHKMRKIGIPTEGGEEGRERERERERAKIECTALSHLW